MLSKATLQTQILQCLHWIFSNIPQTITIDVVSVVEGGVYSINTLWQKISYTALAGDTALDILTALVSAWSGETLQTTSAIVDDKMVITKSITDYFFYFELSDNLKFSPYLDGKIILQDLNSPQPQPTYLTLKIINGVSNISSGNNIKYNTISELYDIKDLKNFTINLQAFGKNSFDFLSFLDNALKLDEVVNYCKIKGVSFANPQDIINVNALINDTYEQRHSLDILCYTTEEFNNSMVSAQSADINLNLEQL